MFNGPHKIRSVVTVSTREQNNSSFSGYSLESYLKHQLGSSAWYDSYCNEAFQWLQAEAAYIPTALVMSRSAAHLYCAQPGMRS